MIYNEKVLKSRVTTPKPQFLHSFSGSFVPILPEIPLAVGLLRGGEDVVAQPATVQLIAALGRGRDQG